MRQCVETTLFLMLISFLFFHPSNVSIQAQTTLMFCDFCITDLAAQPKSTKVQLTWTHDGSSLYRILRSAESATSDFIEIGTTASDYATYLDSPVEIGRDYWYQVKSENGCPSVPVHVNSPRRARNRAPSIISSPVTLANHGAPYIYTVEASDPERKPLTFFLDIAPPEMLIKESTGEITWTPTEEYFGTQVCALVRINDNYNVSDGQFFHIEVTKPTDEIPPVIQIQIPESGSLHATDTLTTQISYSDETELDFTTLKIFLNDLDRIILFTINPKEATGLLENLPEGPNTLIAQINDKAGNQSTDTSAFTIDTTLPQIQVSQTPEPNQFGWNNTDVTVTYSCTDNVSGIQSCPGDQVATTEVRNQIIEGTAEDNAGNKSTTSITINLDKTPPQLSITEPNNDITVKEPSITITGTVSDALSGIASVTCNEQHLAVSGNTYSIIYTLAEGENILVIEAIDSAGNSRQDARTIIYAPNQSPQITSTPITCINRNELYSYDVEATDPDSDPIQFYLIEYPMGMTIEPSTGLIEWNPGDAPPPGININDGLVAYYPFNGNANDESGNGNHGIVNGATLTEDRCGNENSAYNFTLNAYTNGENYYLGEGGLINDHIIIPENILNSPEITISIWFFNKDEITENFSYEPPYSFHLFNTYDQLHNEQSRFFLGFGDFTSVINGEIFGIMGRQNPDYPRSGVLGSNVENIEVGWHHFALKSGPNGHSYFLDGIEYIPDVFNTWTSQTNLVPITETTIAYIGGSNSVIDNIRIYNRVLSNTEIQYLYGQYPVAVKAEDPHGAFDEQSFAINVIKPENNPPQITSHPPTESFCLDEQGDEELFEIFEEVQSFPVTGSMGSEYFTIDGNQYLLICIHRSNSNYNVESKLYKFENDSFVEYQSISTHGAGEAKYFQIDGKHYFGIINHTDGSTYELHTQIYEWEGQNFIPFQSISSLGPIDIEVFQFEDNTFLAIAHAHDDPFMNYQTDNRTNIIQTKLYKWDGTIFNEFQSFDTYSASDAKYFSINDTHYLAITNHYQGTRTPSARTYGIDSEIYQWNGSIFVQYQSIRTCGAAEINFFSIDSSYYCAVASYICDDDVEPHTYNTISNLYEWENGYFNEIQGFQTIGAYNLCTVKRKSDTYLCFSQAGNDHLEILKWDSEKFIPYKQIPNANASYVKSFTIGSDDYLCVSNYSAESKLYRWRDISFPSDTGVIGGVCRPDRTCDNGLTCQEITIAFANEQFVYDVEAIDPDGDHLTYSLTNAPEGMTINSENGIIDWVPNSDDLGNHLINIIAADNQEAADPQSFELTVIKTKNNPPQVTSTPVELAYANELYTYQVTAEDLDNDVLTYSLLDNPINMEIDPEGGLISWIPNNSEKGEHTIRLVVEDQYFAADTQSFRLIVEPSCIQPPEGMISWWPGDGHNQDIVGKTIGTITNINYSSSKVDNAFSLSGTESYIEILNDSSLNPTNGITIEGWIYPVAGASMGIASKLNSLVPGNTGWGLCYYGNISGNTWNRVTFFISTNHASTSCESPDSSVPFGKWSHVAGTSDGSTMKIYVDGKLMFTTPSPPIPENDFTLLIGAFQRQGTKEQFFNGAIDELSLYNRALSEQEIQDIFNAGKAGKCKPPVINQQPVVKAGPDQTIIFSEQITLNGSATDDGLPSGILTTVWLKLSGTGEIIFNDSLALNTIVTFADIGEYEIELRASDSEFETRDTLIVIVKPQMPVVCGDTVDYPLPKRDGSGPGRWIRTSDMEYERSWHRLSLLLDGNVLVCGGVNQREPITNVELYNPTTRTWSALQSMNIPRDAHTATVLQDGRILVTGGHDGSGAAYTATAEIYDPVTNTWKLTASMRSERSWHTASRLDNGRVLVVGGLAYNAINTTEIFDPITETWIQSGILNTARFDHTATLTTNGKVVVIGGRGNVSVDQVEIYDINLNSWSVGMSADLQRFGHSANLLSNGIIIVCGGANNSNSALNRTDFYDPLNDIWTNGPNLKTPRHFHKAILANDSELYVIGGFNESQSEINTMEVFNIEHSNLQWAPFMYNPRGGHDVIQLKNGNILVTGSDNSKDCEVFIPGTSGWQNIADMLVARADHTTNILNNGFVLVTGGRTTYNQVLSSTELYDYQNDIWLQASSMIIPRARHEATRLYDGTVLVTGGYSNSNSGDNGPAINSVEIYEPANNIWFQAAPMNEARYAHTATLLCDGRVLVTGGYDYANSNGLASNEIYNPNTDTWINIQSFEFPRYHHTATLLADQTVLISGGYNLDDRAYLPTVLTYDPVMNIWFNGEDLNIARSKHATMSLPNGFVIVMGGYNRGLLKSTEIYNPQMNIWNTGPSMNKGRFAWRSVLMSNGWYMAVGGSNNTGGYFNVEAYNPTVNKWIPLPSMNNVRDDSYPVLLPNGKVLMAGGESGQNIFKTAEIFDPNGNPHSDNAPIAKNDTFTVFPNSTFSVSQPGVLTNDVDNDGDPLIASVIIEPINGDLSFFMDGSFTYKPKQDFTGIDSFAYCSIDETLESDKTIVFFNVTFLNQPPVVNAGQDQTITLPNKALLNGTVNDDGLPAGSVLSSLWSVISGPRNVTFSDATNPITEVSFTIDGTYYLQLTGDDTELITHDTVIITVQPQVIPNQAPIVNAGEDQTITLPANTHLNGSVTDNTLPTGGILTSEWSMISGPGSVVFDDPASPVTNASFSDPGEYVLQLRGFDTELPGYDSIKITVLPEIIENQPPIVTITPSDTSIHLYDTLLLIGDIQDDSLPEDSVLTYEWGYLSGPTNPFFVENNGLSIRVVFPDTGTYEIILIADDKELTGYAIGTIHVLPHENKPPIVFAGNDTTIFLPFQATLNGSATDDNLPEPAVLTYVWEMTSGPGTVTIADPSQPITMVSFEDTGTYIFRLIASDSQLHDSDEVVITVLPEAPNTPPEVFAGNDQTITLPDPTAFSAVVTDDGLPLGSQLTYLWSLLSGSSSCTIESPDSQTTIVTFDQIGFYVIQFAASDGEYTSNDTVEVTVFKSPDGNYPNLEITYPYDSIVTTITQPIDIIGTARDDDLFYYTLEYREKNSPSWIEFMRSEATVEDGILGHFDPTLLPNGMYDIRLYAIDFARQSVSQISTVVIDGGMKLGQLNFAKEDLSLPAPRLPLSFAREYDSRKTESGDFGPGWHLPHKSVQTAINVPIGEDWIQNESSGPYGILYYDLLEQRQHVITIRFSDMDIDKFRVTVYPPQSTGLSIKEVTIGFSATENTLSTLETLDYPTQAMVEGVGITKLLTSSAEIYNPQRFRLTRRDGTVYIISTENGIESVTDPYGNTVTYDENSIIHSSDPSISFTRDESNRIVRATDNCYVPNYYQHLSQIVFHTNTTFFCHYPTQLS